MLIGKMKERKPGKGIASRLVCTTLAVIICLTGLPMTAKAANSEDMKSMLTSPTILGPGANTVRARRVGFAGKEWYVIGYGSNGSIANADANGGMTLLGSVHDSWDSVQFNPSSNPVNMYKNSSLQTYFNNVYNALSIAEKNAIITRNLEGGSGNYNTTESPAYDSNKIAGEDVNGAAFWPLSVEEAQNICSDLLNTYDLVWLRSPGVFNNRAAVWAGSRASQNGGDVSGTCLAWPALYLNPESIVFISYRSDGKNPGASGDGTLNQVATVTVGFGGGWKLTLIDSARNAFSASRTGSGNVVSGDTIKVNFSGASTETGEYVSAVLVSSNDTSDLLYYGHIATQMADSPASGVNVTIPAGLADGTYILKVFSEKVNTAVSTSDFVSNPESNKIIIDVVSNGGTPTTMSQIATGGTPIVVDDNEELEETAASTKKDWLETLDEIIDEAINEAIKEGTPQTIYLKGVTGLPITLMRKLKDNPQITLDMSYSYEGVDYHAVVPGKSVIVDDTIPWYGPLYLNKYYSR